MHTLLKPLPIRAELLDRNIKLFTPEVFQRVFRSSPPQTKYFLETQVREGGLLARPKQGLYSLRTDPPAAEELANALYQPSYLSFEYALSYHGIIPERPYTITSATTKATASFTTRDLEFAYYKIKIAAYTGYSLRRDASSSFLLADPEKALVDYLYFVSLGKRTLNDRIDTTDLNTKKLRVYAKLYQRPSLESLLDNLLAPEKLRRPRNPEKLVKQAVPASPARREKHYADV